jgi:hypothetical protein
VGPDVVQRSPQLLLASVGTCGERAVDERDIRFHRLVGARRPQPETRKTLQTTNAARDRLRKPTAERGLTMGELIKVPADTTPTVQERAP